MGTVVGLSVWLLCASQARDHQAVTLLRCSTPWALLTMIRMMMMAMDMMELSKALRKVTKMIVCLAITSVTLFRCSLLHHTPST